MYKIVLLIFLPITLMAAKAEQGVKPKLRAALEQIKTATEKGTSLKENPLCSFKFEQFICQSYLYYYRALGSIVVAKNNKEKLRYLNDSLEDLKKAKSFGSFNGQKIDQLMESVFITVLELERANKNWKMVLNTINKMSEKNKKENRIILYYAEALFNSSQKDDFKRLARKYPTLFADTKTQENVLKPLPLWSKELAQLAEENPIPLGHSRPTNAQGFSKEVILNDPIKALSFLGKDVYFSQAQDVGKIASALYFSLYDKNDLTPQQQKFSDLFKQRMFSFAPTLMDSLITSHWKKADLKTAEALSKVFLQQFAGHPSFPKTLFNLGRIQEDAKNYTEAAKTYERFLQVSNDPVYLELAHFRLAWVFHLSGLEKEAKLQFERSYKYFPEGRYASTSEYYVLKFSKKDAAHDEAVKQFIKKYPLNLYSFILVDELKWSDNPLRELLSHEDSLKPIEHKLSGYQADIKTLNQISLYNELLDLGLVEDALKVLGSFSEDQHHELFNLYVAAQFKKHNHAHGEVKNLIKAVSFAGENRGSIPWKSLFPCYKKDLIEKVLAQYKSSVSPYLILSLIRQESVFDPIAQSSAKAMGLMQLTQGTAKQIAARLKLSDFSLIKEEDNLALGIKNFIDLLKKYNYRIDYALSAYNAGDAPVKLWIKFREHLSPMEFIESIPYPETRNYVKTILRNFAIYRMLYHHETSPLVLYTLDGE